MSLVDTLTERPHVLLQPSPDVFAAAIQLAKGLLDPLAQDVADCQKTRRDENRKKRKRADREEEEQVLQLRSVYTSGVGVKQVWEQARRVLAAACSEVERQLPIDHVDGLVNKTEPADADGDIDGGVENVAANEEVDQDPDTDGYADDLTFEDVDGGVEDEDGDQENIEQSESDLNLDEEQSPPQQETYEQDREGLNDGFFSIDDFNKQSQFLEQMDARGEDDDPSEEDEIDWDADPLTMPFNKPKKGQLREEEMDEGSDKDDEEGPTFRNADLNAPDSDDSIQGDEANLEDAMPQLGNANDVMYADFFQPPPKKQSKTKRMRALPKTQPLKEDSTLRLDGLGHDLDDGLHRAIQDVNRDIFASESEASDSDASDSNIKRQNLSTHEKQRAKIAAEIRRLEAANVAKRDWTLAGEARAADRPLNSLVEEDLDFERTGKPVPVITAEVSEEIEQLIKRRILAREFDEVIRRRPDSMGNASDTRRGKLDVDDSKPQFGLAEVYEQEHLRATDPNYLDKGNVKTKKHHQEIDRLWKEVSYQLDLLSNLHFKPKRVEAEIKTVEDKPRIAMEDARPAGEGIGADESMLAPQEVYKAAGSRRQGEVVRKGGASLNKEEMSQEEKRRKRRREKERLKKGKTNQGVDNRPTTAKEGKTSKSKKEEKQGILEELKRGNVKVIDRKGDLQSLGKKGAQGVSSGPALKL